MPVEDVKAAVVSALRTRSADVVRALEGGTRDLELNPAADAHPDDMQESRIAAIAATLKYSLDAIESGEHWLPIPRALAEHVHRTARVEVRAGVLVRRCIAVRRRFVTFIREEIDGVGYADPGMVLKHLYETYRPLWEHIIVSVEQEYENERARLANSPERQRTSLVRRLFVEDLSPAEHEELGYEVNLSWHLGIIATGPARTQVLRALEDGLRRPFLCVSDTHGGTSRAWFGGKGKLGANDIRRLLSVKRHNEVSLAIGEPGFGLAGWRETHEEAQAALLVAQRESGVIVPCANALPVIGALQSKAVVEMFHRTYIAPLDSAYLDGRRVREALRAYFRHGRSPSTAGRAIGVSRRTIENHLNDARRLLGDPVDLTGLEIALRIEELGYMTGSDNPT
jgi:hypothetical protein